MLKPHMRRFYLNREEDATGTSGTGIVAEGVEFSCGKVALTWLSPYVCVAFYESMHVVEVLHGHQGRTRVEWVDDDGLKTKDSSK